MDLYSLKTIMYRHKMISFCGHFNSRAEIQQKYTLKTKKNTGGECGGGNIIKVISGILLSMYYGALPGSHDVKLKVPACVHYYYWLINKITSKYFLSTTSTTTEGIKGCQYNRNYISKSCFETYIDSFL